MTEVRQGIVEELDKRFPLPDDDLGKLQEEKLQEGDCRKENCRRERRIVGYRSESFTYRSPGLIIV